MDDEIDALVKNETWNLVRLPSGKKAIGSKWVYKVKCKSDGSVERYKARLVAKGYAQTKGLDYDETFSPVAKMTTVKLVIAMASMSGWKLWQIDVNNTFLNGDLEEEVYMIQPEGYQHPEFPYYVCRLKKELYGLKQAPRAWCEKITRFLKKIGFKQSTTDYSLFLKHVHGEIVIIVIYVNDLILIGSHDEKILDVKKNANWGGDFMDKRSTSGYAFSIGNGMISWSSKKQPIVALSSTKAEYCGATMAACEQSWLRVLMVDFGFDNLDSVTIYCDNISSIMLAKNPVYHAHTKHIEVHYHFIREKVLAGETNLVYVKKNDQVAAIFTKALGKEKFCYFCEALGIHHMQAHSELEGEC
ncbi:hypothetical protein L7F22_059816 [Adiantum nelumboides]|nr:hypothetical protein [Adiantum nelumboides]